MEVVGWKCFATRGKKGQYEFVGLLQFEGNSNTECLNFTHRSTLGGGDDADQTSGKFTDLANQQL